MKHVFFAFALVASSAYVSAFAQTPSPAQTTNGSLQVASNVPNQWVGPYDQTTGPKTRAQVLQELLQAKRDGQLALLDSTVYTQ
jgi:hypothetical protein